MTKKLNSYPLDLHGFIDYLTTEHPEEIVRITKEVDPKFGVSGILNPNIASWLPIGLFIISSEYLIREKK